jgi:hypothetical protein
MIPQIRKLSVRIASPGVRPQAEDVAFFAIERKIEICRDEQCMFTVKESAAPCDGA